MYIMESKDELVLVDFFFHLIPFVVCDTCDLSKVTKEIFVTNATKIYL